MSREAQVRFCESRGVKLPPATHLLVLVSGARADAERMRDEVGKALAPMGLRLSQEKTLVTHIDDGLDFLGWHIQRHRKRGTARHYVYTYPSRKAVKAVMDKVRKVTGRRTANLPLTALIHHLNPVLRGWSAYFRPGVSKTAFQYLSHFTWQRIIIWIRRKHPRITWKDLRRCYCGSGWWPASEEGPLFDPAKVRTTRYRYRGTLIPSPWPAAG